MPSSCRPARLPRTRLAVACAVLTAVLAASPATAATTVIGGPGVGPGTIDGLSGVAADAQGNVFALDSQRPRLQKFTSAGVFVAGAGASGSGLSPVKFSNPLGLTIDPAGKILVADSGNQRLISIGADLSTETGTVVIAGSGWSPWKVAATASKIFTLGTRTGFSDPQLERYTNTASPTLDAAASIPIGSGPGQIASMPQNLAMAADPSTGDVYISDPDNQRVLVFDSSLAYQRQITGFSQKPLGVAADGSGGQTQVYVGDAGFINGTVKRLSPTGALRGTFGPAYPGNAGLLPVQLATDPLGNVLIGENRRVVRIDTTPDPVIAATPATGLTAQSPTFDASASTVSLWGVAGYRWDLDGSGTFSTDTGLVPTAVRQFLAAGSYPISVRVTGTNGRVAEKTISYPVGESSATLSGPNRALTGQSLTFDASGSALPASTITGVSWDFDNAGTFATSTGTTPTVAHRFDTAGTHTVRVRVVRSGGRVDVAALSVPVFLTPPDDTVGVSIEDGNFATDGPQVHLRLSWPEFATRAIVSNDGGFRATGQTRTVALAPEVPWTLRSSGAERLPRTVYVRFLGAGTDTQTFTDDIVLDERPPDLAAAQAIGVPGASARTWLFSVSPGLVASVTAWPPGLDGQIVCGPGAGLCQASYAEGAKVTVRAQAKQDPPPAPFLTIRSVCGTSGATATVVITAPTTCSVDVGQGPWPFGSHRASAAVGSGARTAAKARPRLMRKYRVRLSASDANSGVAAIQVSGTRSGGARLTLAKPSRRGASKVAKTVSAWLTKAPRYVRVRDAAGNWSKWRAVKAAKR